MSLPYDEEVGVDVTVSVTEPLGELTYVHFELGEEVYTATVPSDHIVDEGDTITVLFPEDRIHLFDGTTNETLKNREFSAEDEAEWGITA